jgi:hypothetical protein
MQNAGFESSNGCGGKSSRPVCRVRVRGIRWGLSAFFTVCQNLLMSARNRLSRRDVDLSSRSVLLIGLDHHYQYKEGVNPSALEKAQRTHFTERMKQLIGDFKPTVIADESPDTANADLLALYPNDAVSACVDIPFAVKVRSNLMVARPEDGSLCPYVDDLREKFWERRIRHATEGRPNSRILMLCGAQHLYSFPSKLFSFVHRLALRGYQVSFIDLRREPWWDASWADGWIDPDPKPLCIQRSCCIALGADLQMNPRNCALSLRWRTQGRRAQIFATRIRSSQNP